MFAKTNENRNDRLVKIFLKITILKKKEGKSSNLVPVCISGNFDDQDLLNKLPFPSNIRKKGNYKSLATAIHSVLLKTRPNWTRLV